MTEIIIFFVSHWYLSLFVQTMFLHRYASHQMFTMSKGWEKIFFFLKSDVDVNEFAAELEETCHKEGLTEGQVHRKVDVASRAELASASKTFAIDQFPGSFDGWCLVYVKGPNGEQLEFNQVKTTCKENFISAQQLYNRLAGSSYQWPSN